MLIKESLEKQLAYKAVLINTSYHTLLPQYSLIQLNLQHGSGGKDRKPLHLAHQCYVRLHRKTVLTVSCMVCCNDQVALQEYIWGGVIEPEEQRLPKI